MCGILLLINDYEHLIRITKQPLWLIKYVPSVFIEEVHFVTFQTILTLTRLLSSDTPCGGDSIPCSESGGGMVFMIEMGKKTVKGKETDDLTTSRLEPMMARSKQIRVTTESSTSLL